MHSKEIQDKYNITWLLCVVLGIGQLFSFNAYISAYDYYVYVFGAFGNPFMFFLPIANNWGSIMTFLFLSKYGDRIPVNIRLYGSYFTIFAMLCVVPIINLSGLDLYVRVGLTLFSCFISGSMSSTLIGTCFGLVANLPDVYTGGLMSGQGVAGVFAGILKLCMVFWWFAVPAGETASDASKEQSGVLYFGIGAIIMLFCAGCTAVLQKMEFYRQHQKIKKGIQSQVDTSAESFINLKGEIEEPLVKKPTSKREVLWKIKKEAAIVWLVFFITLSLFPGFTTEIRNYDKNIDINNFGLILITLFQLFDCIGRTIPKWFVFPPKRYLFIPVGLRLVFYPLFLLSVYTDYFPNNAISFATMITFALSNGYFSTVAMMYGPTNVSREEQETAGFLMGLCLQLGVFSGVHGAILFKYCAERKLF